MTEIPSELIMAYEATDFTVLEQRPFTLRIGRHSAELQALYVERGVTCAGYLTAWNPFSKEISEVANKNTQRKLLCKLSLEGFQALNAAGIDPSGDWPGEESVFVPGLSLGSRLIEFQSQNMTVAARAIAEKKVSGQRSYRVATRRQSFRRPNMISMRLRRL